MGMTYESPLGTQSVTISNVNPAVWPTFDGRGLDAAKPTATAFNVGFLYYSTDVNGGTLYRANGSGWDVENNAPVLANEITTAMIQNGAVTAAKLDPAAVAPSNFIESGALATRPAAGTTANGTLYFATDYLGGTLFRCTGAAWVIVAPGPNGEFSESPRISAGMLPGWANGTVVGDGMLSGTTMTLAGTQASGNMIHEPCMQMITAATINAVASAASPVGPAHGLNPALRTRFSLSSIANVRVWIGLFTTSAPFGSDTVANRCIGFRFSTNAGDTTLHAVVANATTPTIVDTGVTIDSTHTYDCQIIPTDQAGDGIAVITRYLNSSGAYVDTTVTVVTGLPATATPTAPIIVGGIETLSATARQLNLEVVRVQWGQDLGTP